LIEFNHLKQRKLLLQRKLKVVAQNKINLIGKLAG